MLQACHKISLSSYNPCLTGERMADEIILGDEYLLTPETSARSSP